MPGADPVCPTPTECAFIKPCRSQSWMHHMRSVWMQHEIQVCTRMHYDAIKCNAPSPRQAAWCHKQPPPLMRRSQRTSILRAIQYQPLRDKTKDTTTAPHPPSKNHRPRSMRSHPAQGQVKGFTSLNVTSSLKKHTQLKCILWWHWWSWNRFTKMNI